MDLQKVMRKGKVTLTHISIIIRASYLYFYEVNKAVFIVVHVMSSAILQQRGLKEIMG